MGRTNRRLAAQTPAALVALVWVLMTSCTHKVQIEPSDKPFVVNLNVKVDHEIKVRMEEENQDLLSLEDEVVPRKAAGKKSGGKKK